MISLFLSIVMFVAGFVGGFSVALLLKRQGGNPAEVFRALLGVAILAVVGIGTYTSLSAAGQLEELARCQNAAARQTSASQVAVREAATRQDAAQRDLSVAQVDLLTAQAQSPEQGRAAVDRYVAAVRLNISALDDLAASRVANPLPQPTLCGGPTGATAPPAGG